MRKGIHSARQNWKARLENEWRRREKALERMPGSNTIREMSEFAAPREKGNRRCGPALPSPALLLSGKSSARLPVPLHELRRRRQMSNWLHATDLRGPG